MTRKAKPFLVVVEVQGGAVQNVYSNVHGLRVLLVDWDNIKEGDGKVHDYQASSLRDMSEESREQVGKGMKEAVGPDKGGVKWKNP